MRVALTIDVEQDCPPFMGSFRGIEEGLPKLLGLLEKKGIKTTLFTTGDIALRYPQKVEGLVNNGHEIGCHGNTHERFDKLGEKDAQKEIRDATKILRRFYPATCFRAPCLQFPKEYLKYLIDEGYKIDSSEGRHKNPFLKISEQGGLTRIPASTTSLVIRMPKPFRNMFLARLKDPVVLFVHPWEFVDLRKERLRFDCRYNTGEKAFAALNETIDFFRGKKAKFLKMEELI